MAFAHAGFEERIARLLVALETRPEDAALHFELADVRCQHEEWNSSLTELDRVDRLAPGKYFTDFLRGEAFLGNHQPREAKAALDRFIGAHPESTQALTFRARANAALPDLGACLADYGAAWRTTEHPEPDLVQEYSDALAAAGRREESLQVLEAGIEKVGPVPGLVELALQRESAAGRFDAALTRIAALQKTAPRPEPWMAKRAALLAQAGRIAEARAAWEKLRDHLAALPNLERGSHAMSILAEEAQRELARLKADAGADGAKFTAAAIPTVAIAPPPPTNQVAIKAGSIHEEELGRANEQVAAAPGNAQVWFQRSVLLLLDEDFASALRDAEQAERLAPGKFFTGWVRGQALAGLGELERGRAVLDEFIAQHPDHAGGFVARARVWDKFEQASEALADYRAALHVGAEPQAELVMESINVLVAHGHAEEAADALDAALRKLGAVPAALQRSLELDTHLGRFDAALARIDELQKIAPRPEPWMAKRAALLQQAGRADVARQVWQELLTRLDSLPNLQRGSASFRTLAQQAREALAAR